ncbi:unnamed protein product [Rotaria socialis]|uniref:Homeobox domain-containing protein n=3 Tax=Rotaria socialis TaxID=392032 RepID=A0A820SHP0_9BILA|nr:unnamed protein product [Rotaria socialis]CAF4174045.1 unnamed protein product [Rotaria socialis]CAF4458111.1 unnamed protein product [Rotaria socialis]
MSGLHSAASHRTLVHPNAVSPTVDHNDPLFSQGALRRDPSTLSTNDIGFPKVLENDGDVQEQTVMQVEIENEPLMQQAKRSELASKNALLTQRWQTILVVTVVLTALAAGIGGLGYWISIPKVITQPFLLYGASCYMNSRSCDATRFLWCPAGTCVCTGNYQWNVTAQNCSCGVYQKWTGFKCQDYGYYGDPCNSVPCQPTLTCMQVINQTYTTSQDICVCDSVTYLETVGVNSGTCVSQLTYNASCLTNSDCKSALGLSCANVGGILQCQCSSTAYWNGSYCSSNALGGQPCSVSVPCDTKRGLTCTAGICECDSYSYWDNVTTEWCQEKKTYAIGCQYSFQCNTTVNLSCPSTPTGCDCPTASSAGMCDCASTTFWDGQRCSARHSFNGTCPGQYACTANLVCYLGHCICPGNMHQPDNVQFVTMSSQSRHVYTREERTILEASFACQSHPNIMEKERLAKLLNCNIIQISNWFQNHRRRMKKQNKSTLSNISTSIHTVSADSPMYQPPCAYHQSQCAYNINADNSSYYYYYHPPTSQYIYSHEPVYMQTTYFDPLVTYEQ